ncbi:MAG: bifunctional acetate--CoA ligase family protein/GNAT family N-acetyltransferase [Rhodospirillaceae bacterium]|nr:bifunctional acetate--CoA ligase family protein/GNAT family N-acetyltransferase [Rhodospirillaceae bacterium]
MSVRNLDAVFKPKSVVLVGASDRAGSIGAAVTKNTLGGSFAGDIHLINRRGGTIAGRRALKSPAELPAPADLAVIATPPETVPQVVAELAAAGTRAAVVITAGFGEGSDPEGKKRRQQVLDAARPHLMRVVGPNCVGFLAPRLGLNASFAPSSPPGGKVAFVGQSGAVLVAVIDWAADRGIGFSYLVSMGNMADVDFGDVLDYLALDGDTRAILLYVEGLTHSRKFMSAARAAARLKPVVVLKAGRFAEGARAAQSHTGAMAGADAVYDAAFRRAGLLRVYGLGELFDATEVLGLSRPPRTDQLAILSNGGGFGVLAADDLGSLGGKLAAIQPQTMAALNKVLPETWSHANPIDIIGDADDARYVAALDAVAADTDVGAVLVMNAPTALASSVNAAKAISVAEAGKRVPLIACWMGGRGADEGRRIFEEAGVPAYDTPLRAVRAFQQLVEFRRSQEALMQTPPSSSDGTPDIAAAQRIIAAALAEGRSVLTEPEAKGVVAAFGIPIVPTEVARDEMEAADIAEKLGFPVALKILSRDISHKSDVGGVRLNLDKAEAVLVAAREMRARVTKARPDARIDGFTVSPMIRRPDAYELILGTAEDPLFGPVLLFGQGGTSAEIVADRAMALPPLNLALAEDVMRRTRIDRLLHGYRDKKPAARHEIALTLVRLSRLVAELDSVAELDINPLLADADGVIALDARIVVRPVAERAEHARRFAIRPYPSELESSFEYLGVRYRMRPIRPEDEPAVVAAFGRMTPDDVRMRFFAPIKQLSHELAARLSQIDYDREMALVLTEGDRTEITGIVRIAADPDFEKAEFAIMVMTPVQGRGIGRLLMDRIIDYAKSRGIRQIFGDVLVENQRMLNLARDLGFTVSPLAESPSIRRVTKTL